MRSFTKIIYILVILSIEKNLCSENKIPSINFDGINNIFHISIDKIDKSETGLTSYSNKTIQVKKKTDFPKQLLPGQRVALFLDSLSEGRLDKENYHLKMHIEMQSDKRKHVPISILFNNKPILRNKLPASLNSCKALIPSIYIEDHENILQIRNEGLENIIFHSLSVDYYCPWNKKRSANDKTEKKLPVGIIRLSKLVTQLTHKGDVFQYKLLKTIPFEVVSILQDVPDCSVRDILKYLLKNKDFFDKLTGKPKKSYIALQRITPLFEGNPFLVESNMIPVAKDSFISNTTWTTVVNNKNTVTAVIASEFQSGKDVNIIIPVNWTNDDSSSVKAKLTLTAGILPEKYSDNPGKIEIMKTESKDVSIKKGIFKTRFKLSQCTIIRLKRIDCEKTEILKKIKLSSKIRKLKTELVKFRITDKRPPSDSIRDIVRGPGAKLVKITGTGIDWKETDATKSTIENIENVVPQDAKSIHIAISFPASKHTATGTVRIFTSYIPTNFKSFSFWVYPRSEKKKSTVALNCYLSSEFDKKSRLLKCRLKTNQWQRIEIPRGKRFSCWSSVLVSANSKSPDYKDGNKVTFEFNGFSALAKPDDNFYKRIIIGRKSGGQIKFFKMIFLGNPGSQGEYQYLFDQPIEFKSLNLLTKAKKGYTPSLTYLKDAQLLDVKIKFPRDQAKTHSPDFMNILTEKEKKMISKKGLAIIGIEFILKK